MKRLTVGAHESINEAIALLIRARGKVEDMRDDVPLVAESVADIDDAVRQLRQMAVGSGRPSTREVI